MVKKTFPSNIFSILEESSKKEKKMNKSKYFLNIIGHLKAKT